MRRQKLKAEDMAVVKEWRKRQKRGTSDSSEFPEELLDPKNKKRRDLLEAAGPVQVKGFTKGKKRLAKDAKYGSGGAKRFKKTNDAESAADMGGFSKRRNSQGAGVPRSQAQRSSAGGFPSTPQRKNGAGGGFGQRPKKVAQRRPGKAARKGGA